MTYSVQFRKKVLKLQLSGESLSYQKDLRFQLQQSAGERKKISRY